MPRYAEIIYNGFWFSPERVALQALIDETQKYVTGTVKLKLYKVCEAPPTTRVSARAFAGIFVESKATINSSNSAQLLCVSLMCCSEYNIC
jgi:argininosuccinate synthase